MYPFDRYDTNYFLVVPRSDLTFFTLHNRSQ
jgi:hypothetical protein